MFTINTESEKARRLQALLPCQNTASASAQQHTVTAAAPHVQMPTEVDDFDEDGKRIRRPLTDAELQAAKEIIKSVRKTTSQNQQIIDFNERIGAIENYLKLLKKDIRDISPRLHLVMDANKAIKELVVARNQKALDVLSVYSRFSFDASAGVDAVTMKDFKAFTHKLGYNFICKDQTKYNILLGTVLKGIGAGRFLKDSYGFKNVIEVARKVTELNSEVGSYTEKLNQAQEEHTKLTKNLQPQRTDNVSPDSFIDSFKQSLTRSRSEASKLRTRIEQAQHAIEDLKTLGDTNTDAAQESVTAIIQQINMANTARDSIQARLGDLGKKIKKMVHEKAALQVKFEKKTSEKRDAKLRQLSDKYAGKRNAAALIAEDIREWDRIQRLTLKTSLKNVEQKHADALGDGSSTSLTILKSQQAEVTDLEQQLTTITSNIGTLTANLKRARLGAALDPLARQERLSLLQQQLNTDREALHAAQKRVKRRTAALETQVDEDIWEGRLNEFLGVAKNAKEALAIMPNTFLYNTLLSGAEDTAKEQVRLMWNAFKRNRTKEIVFPKAQFAAKHFGASGFIPVPKFKRYSTELNQILAYALGAASKTQDLDDAKEILLPVLLSIVNPSAETEQKTHTAFQAQIKRINTWLLSSKALPITEEIVEDLLQSGKMPLPLGKKTLNAKIVTATSKQMLQMLVSNDAVGKLASLAYVSYRSYMSLWLRKNFKLAVKAGKSGEFQSLSTNPSARNSKLAPAPIGKIKRKPVVRKTSGKKSK